MSYIRIPFASAGDRTTVPQDTQVDGTVSFEQGFGPDYSLPRDSDPDAKTIPRTKYNEIMYILSGAIQQLQQNGLPTFITSAENDGSPFPYAINSMVRWDNGSGDISNYISLIGSNTTDPSNTTNWRKLSANNVIGPASATANALARYDGTTGLLIKNSGATLDDSGNLLLTGSLGCVGDLKLYETVGSGNNYISIIAPTSLSGNFTLTLPAFSGTVATLAGTETFTNKTLTSPVISGGTIDNAVIGGTTAAAGTFSTLSVAGPGSTLSGAFIGLNIAGSTISSAGGNDITGLQIAANTITSAADEVWGLRIRNTTISSSGTADYTGIELQMPTWSANIPGSSMVGLQITGANFSTTTGFGSTYTAINISSPTANNSGTVTTSTGITILNQGGGGGVATGQGLHIFAQSGGTTANYAIRCNDGFTVRGGGDVQINTAALATNATEGFLYIPSCNGTPTGTPATRYTGAVALCYDYANNIIYAYNTSTGTWKKTAALT